MPQASLCTGGTPDTPVPKAKFRAPNGTVVDEETLRKPVLKDGDEALCHGGFIPCLA